MLKSLEINGFKSFRRNSTLVFDAPISVIVGPNGSGKSNTAEAFRFVLGEQSLKALRARHSDELLYNGGHEGSRANRASVKAVFDNSNKQLDIEYSEVVIERIIQRGDASEYRINGSRVRLKDVADLLSDANIGTSRHHIISQGEADRILNISERERKGVIEDALGLRRFYQQRRDALHKLEKTEDNLTQVKERLRDLQPEVSFLTRQKKRIDETKKLRQQLTKKYQQFFKRESLLLDAQSQQLREKKKRLVENLSSLKDEIADKEKILHSKEEILDTSVVDEISQIKSHLEDTEKKLSHVTQKLGEIHGQLQALQRQQEIGRNVNDPDIRIDNSSLRRHKENFDTLITKSDNIEDQQGRLDLFAKFQAAVREFLGDIQQSSDTAKDTKNDNDEADQIKNLQQQKLDIEDKKQTLQEKKTELQTRREKIDKEQQQKRGQQHEAEKKLLQLRSQLENTSAELERTEEQNKDTIDAIEQLDNERAEAQILCGSAALETGSTTLVDAAGTEVTQEELIEGSTKRSNREFNRQLERLKIKLENTRVSDKSEILREYERVTEHVDFLQGEMSDLRTSKESLLELISDIEETVAQKFDRGVKRINTAFGDFFATMFGGGDAQLSITEHPKGKNVRVEDIDEDPNETERGIDISVRLPNKKVSGLGVLSGGERSLVSIALLFALSQINPPPFIVLDEADAALDESNSQRFGDMIEKLSNRSQLVVVTHNRETMSRADILYGVTMDQAGGSRLLSLNFSEAMDTVES
ncbi:MAG: AAA family ATPase [Candidatus Paceibacterota bacterium]